MSYKDEFPILKNFDIHYLDNAATSQKPTSVINALSEYYRTSNGNAGRGSHDMAIKSEQIIEDCRKRVADFLHADADEIVFTSKCTQSLNLIAFSYGMNVLDEEDEIILSISNHHANIVPWQQVAKKTGAIIRYVYTDEDGNFDLESFEKMLGERTKIVAFSGVVNATGVINPVEEIIELSHRYGAITVLDAAQSIVHTQHDVRKLDCDFLAFSGHKLFSAFGVGVLYGKRTLLEKMPAFEYGGDMIEFVEEFESTFKSAPHRFEAGTMDSAAIYSLHKAIDFVADIGYDNMVSHVDELTDYAVERLSKLEYLELYHTSARHRVGVIAFNVKGVHSHDTSFILNEHGVMVRSGHHCTQPLMKYLNIPSCCRISIGIYNDKEDIDALVQALEKVVQIFK